MGWEGGVTVLAIAIVRVEKASGFPYRNFGNLSRRGVVAAHLIFGKTFVWPREFGTSR